MRQRWMSLPWRSMMTRPCGAVRVAGSFVTTGTEPSVVWITAPQFGQIVVNGGIVASLSANDGDRQIGTGLRERPTSEATVRRQCSLPRTERRTLGRGKFCPEQPCTNPEPRDDPC